MSTTRWAALAVAFFSAGALSADTTYTFQTFSGPGGGGTEAWGINGAGDVVGYYTGTSSNLGFEYNPTSNTFTTLTGPSGASDIRAFGINDTGAIVGTYRDSANVTHGFLYSNGTYNTIDAPGAQFGTYVTGINNSGQLALTYSTVLFSSAYRWTPSGSGYTSQSLSVASDGTFTAGINNNGEVAGYYQTPNYGGYLWNNSGTYSTFLEPNDQAGTTQALDVNDNGEVVGSWFSPTGEAGYVDQGGVFTTINAPSSTYTYVTGVNDSGEISGWYLDASDQMHSFIATAVPEPAAFAMLALCAVVVLLISVRGKHPVNTGSK
jgi:probable HAF family extracellular repeat protein